MYKIQAHEYINEQPWIKPFAQRLHQLFHAKQNNLKVVMYLYERPDTSTFRYRVYNMCQALELSLHWRGVYFYQDELRLINKYLNKIDLLIVARFRWTFELDAVINTAKFQGVKVIFEIDDMVYNTAYLPIIVNTLSVNMASQADYDYWFAYISRLNATARLCDAIITTNDFLAKKMVQDLDIPAYVIQNFTNRLQEEVSEDYFRQKEYQYSEGNFVIGYFSGTPSHINDFLAIAPEIKELLEKHQEIIFRIVGFMDMPDFLAELKSRGQIEQRPLVNFLDLQKEIAEVDVNVVPLVNNDFSNCKSELKFYEASIVGTISCATPTYIFQQVIQDSVNGYLCDRGKWFSTLERLYEERNLNHLKILNNARSFCLERYAYFNQVSHIEKIFEEILKSM